MANSLTTVLSSAAKTVEVNRELPTAIIGERINPTGRKAMLAALQAGNYDIVRKDAIDQVAAGAAMLDVNAGVPGADEPALLTHLLSVVMEVTDVPLCIDTANPIALAAALRCYQGKALVNSVNGEERSLSTVLPVVAEYKAAVIGLCMDDDGIPETPEQRLKVAARIIERAGKLGIPPEDVVIDPLALTMGADSNAGACGTGYGQARRRRVRCQHDHGRQQHIVRAARPAIYQLGLRRHGHSGRDHLPDHEPPGDRSRHRSACCGPGNGARQQRDALDQGFSATPAGGKGSRSPITVLAKAGGQCDRGLDSKRGRGLAGGADQGQYTISPRTKAAVRGSSGASKNAGVSASSTRAPLSNRPVRCASRRAWKIL